MLVCQKRKKRNTPAWVDPERKGEVSASSQPMYLEKAGKDLASASEMGLGGEGPLALICRKSRNRKKGTSAQTEEATGGRHRIFKGGGGGGRKHKLAARLASASTWGTKSEFKKKKLKGRGEPEASGAQLSFKEKIAPNTTRRTGEAVHHKDHQIRGGTDAGHRSAGSPVETLRRRKSKERE